MDTEVELQLLNMMLVDDTKFTLRNDGVFDFEGAIKQAEECDKPELADFMKESHDNVREVLLYMHKVETKSDKHDPSEQSTVIYLATYFWDSSDGWYGGETGTNILFVTPDKKKMDDYLASLNPNEIDKDNITVTVVKTNVDYLSEIGPETETLVDSGYDEVEIYDEHDDV
jgi:hypothetical protein